MFWNEHYYFKYLKKIMQILMKVYFTWSQLCRATPNLVDIVRQVIIVLYIYIYEVYLIINNSNIV